ncbi:alpha beta hydrolase fold-3 domain protein [Nannochloropsis gaditana]|uniref:Alpha beta hydrolase fold-3 domain protein n=1 Tax=Nannochloropsis gaditana TaxID=72520 RepID=W7TM26_9STRA|nr:alpha beta hydrolase fold-3 domain protein [Nannochloropsis gaditana]
MPSPMSLTPASQAFLAQIYPPNAPPARDMPLDVGRAKMEAAARALGGPYLSVRRVEDLSIPSLDGNASVKVRVYSPKIDATLPVLLYAHGGGFVKGNLETHDQLCRRIAVGSDHVVVAVDYRLSPEHRFPAALDDVEAAYTWVVGQVAWDATRISLAGDSAGGNLMSALAVRLAGKPESQVRPEHRIRRQVLIYPVVDVRRRGESYETYGTGYGLSATAIDYYLESYLGPAYTDAKDEDARRAVLEKPEVSTILYQHPEKLPPTLILTAACDPLASEAGLLKERLEAAGVPVRQIIYPDTVHAYMTFFDIFPESEQSLEEIVRFLNEDIGS